MLFNFNEISLFRGMSCFKQSKKKHGSLLLIYIAVNVNFLASLSTDSDCCNNFQKRSCTGANSCEVTCDDGYWGSSCQFGRLRLNQTRGYITDGAGDYTVSSKQMWLIDAGSRANATIHFQIEEFDTECNWDHLYIFDGGSIESPQLAAFNGQFLKDFTSTEFGLIPQEIVAKSGRAFVYFYSDVGVFSTGFNISYSVISNCSCVNGRCNTAGLCLCDSGWTGSLCDTKDNCSNCVNGDCNQTSGHCVCHDGFTGTNCSQAVVPSYWTSLKSDHREEISPRASHAAAVIGDEMWIFGGYRLSYNKYQHRADLYKYNLVENTWKKMPGDNGSTWWGHSMVAYQNKLVVFGGERGNDTSNTLAIFDTTSSVWSYRVFNSAVGVTGHTANVVDSKMIVIFGLSKDGLFPKVQEYDIAKSTWEIVETPSAFGVPRHGHSAVYHPFAKKIYVYGGSVAKSVSEPTADLLAYDPHSKKWITLASSTLRLTLHSAVILDGMMMVFGGNPYINRLEKKCHTSKLLVYDLACQTWHSEDLPPLPRRLSRYGHSAVTAGRKMYVFGGFNGALFNDVITYTHGECSQSLNSSECEKKYFSAGCWWNGSKCLKKDNSTECPAQYKRACDSISSCDECTSLKCGWKENSCQVNGSEVCPPSRTDICRFYPNCNTCQKGQCFWTGEKCQSTPPRNIRTCPTSCHNQRTLQTCLTGDSCLWCENLRRCIEYKYYVNYYPYGQCLEWTTRESPDRDVTCESKKSCRDCLTLPGCGWSEDSSRTGTGVCLAGGADGPKRVSNPLNWNFISCPLCQCNGHSNCSLKSSVCLQCRDNTVGKTCDTCAQGYFGNPRHGQMCRPCECNGHADTCDATTGRCVCTVKGVTGENCGRCQVGYWGNASNGGYCYYRLAPDFRYTINVSDKTMFNFICWPNKSDQDTVVTVDISPKNGLNPALLNISVGSTEFEDFILTSTELTSQYEEQFSKDVFPFGKANFHFKIYIYNITPRSSVTISVHQLHSGNINLLMFFIIFLACFVGLLLFALLFWKAKKFFDSFRRTRRHNVELRYMTNRPFASVPIFIERPGHVPMKNKPSPITSEICYGNKAAVVTVLIRLPLCAQTQDSSRSSALCLGSALVNYGDQQGSRVVDYVKNAKRRRNPFRTART